ncbi:MAG: transglycosylase domain-containing protein [Longimicrobiales bacterium]|nr:transglycosylase domain-containing protein [Longimicrobiales bacterium]
MSTTNRPANRYPGRNPPLRYRLKMLLQRWRRLFEGRRARLLAGAVVLAGTLLLAVGYRFVTPVCADDACPSLAEIDDYRPPEPPHVFDRNGKLAGHLPGRRRIVLESGEIPDLVRDAYVAVEDRRFWDHGGVDPRAVLRAFTRNVEAGETVEGASTITMQLARNIFADEVLEYSPWRRKATEVRLSLSMEARLAKAEILDLYINHIYLGDGVWGVGAAAGHYFGKEVHELSVAETALLVGLAKNPEGYNPRRFPERALERRNVVLDVMAREGVVAEADAVKAMESPIDLSEPSLVWTRGSYYAAAVRRELLDLIPEPGRRAGVRIHTGLDRELQASAEDALVSQISRIEAGELGPYEAPADSSRLQGMAVALDPSSGVVRALVGGRDFSESEFDRAFLARRQPGSAFKPLVLSAALSEGYPLTDLVSVDSLSIPTDNRDPEEDSIWRLADFVPASEDVEEHGTPGSITLRNALVRSSNVAAVRVGMDLGVERVIQEARLLGIETPIPAYPSLFLGSADVVPAELVAAFAAFENGGMRVEPHLITRIESPEGEVLWESPPEAEPALDSRVAFLVRSVLEDVVDDGTGWRVRAQGLTGPAAGKTGTTNDGRDVWFVGMRPGIVGGVWLGFDRPRSILPGATGGRLAAPVWARMMLSLPTSPADSLLWTPPAGVTQEEIDGSTGYLANESCPEEHVRTEYFLEGTEPRQICPLHGRDLMDRIVQGIRSLFR